MLCELDKSGNVGDRYVNIFSNGCRPRITGCTINFVDILGLRELPANGMFASTTTDHEDLHIETASNKPDVSRSHSNKTDAALANQPARCLT